MVLGVVDNIQRQQKTEFTEQLAVGVRLAPAAQKFHISILQVSSRHDVHPDDSLQGGGGIEVGKHWDTTMGKTS